MQSSIVRAGAAFVLLLSLAACGKQAANDGALSMDTEAAAAAEAWYAIIPFEVAPENRARVHELSATTVAPAQAAIGREMLQFFPAGDATSGFLILGRFASEDEARARSNPGQDQEFLAAYQAHMGEAGGAATQETMSMMTPGAALIAHRIVATPPQADGLQPGAAPVYYVAHSLDLTDDADANGGAIIGEDFGPIAEGGEVMMFELTSEAPFDWLVFTGPHNSAGQGGAAASIPVLRDGAAQTRDVAVVYRHPPE
jgi:hypothetical protein